MRVHVYRDQAFGFGVCFYRRDGFLIVQFWNLTWEACW